MGPWPYFINEVFNIFSMGNINFNDCMTYIVKRVILIKIYDTRIMAAEYKTNQSVKLVKNKMRFRRSKIHIMSLVHCIKMII